MWNYSSVLDEPSKQETMELLRKGSCRMVVCMDAFGLVNIWAIPRVVVWKLDAVYPGKLSAPLFSRRDLRDPSRVIAFVHDS